MWRCSVQQASATTQHALGHVLAHHAIAIRPRGSIALHGLHYGMQRPDERSLTHRICLRIVPGPSSGFTYAGTGILRVSCAPLNPSFHATEGSYTCECSSMRIDIDYGWGNSAAAMPVETSACCDSCSTGNMPEFSCVPKLLRSRTVLHRLMWRCAANALGALLLPITYSASWLCALGPFSLRIPLHVCFHQIHICCRPWSSYRRPVLVTCAQRRD